MSKARDKRKRLQRAAAAGGDAHRAIVRLAPDGPHWTPEMLKSGIGKPVRDGEGGPVIGDVRHLRRKDGWIVAEVGLSPEHVARITAPVRPGEFSIASTPGGRAVTMPPALRRVRTSEGVKRYSVEPGQVIR